jgi:hypothetical protein
MKRLPIGISTFSKIVEGDYLYVDKSDIALDLIENGGGYYFLSRPRRFGKSLFLDTLRCIFEGKKELFHGLYIYDKYDFVEYPVIRISFNDGDFKTKEEFKTTILRILRNNQRFLGIECEDNESVVGCFQELIIETNLKYNQKVVILIDEYDKPILDNIDNTNSAKERRDELKNFYSVIKGADEFLQFVFITGVSTFSKVSLFSGLNNLNDITVDKNYATICGYTQNDVETSFASHLEGQDFGKIAQWYNGYKWLGEGVYNPFDILLFIQKGFVYENYWFATATPTFLLKLIAKNNYFLPNLEQSIKDAKMLNSFDVDYIEVETLMWQTGYLTIVDSEETPRGVKYSLAIPNQEVRVSLLGSVAHYMSRIHNTVQLQDNLYKALVDGNIEKFKQHLVSLYASIPYNLFTKNKMHEYEGYYVSIFYSYIKSLGIEVIGEDVTNRGRIDMTIKMVNAIYVIEFKVEGSNALGQIKAKNYHQKYLSDNLPIYLIGIEFDKSERNIVKLEWESINLTKESDCTT